MKLYTINATPIRYNITDTENNLRLQSYEDYVSTVLSKYGIDGFTIYKVKGYWQGKAEISFKIEIATDDDSNIDKIAEILRDTYNQDAVMVTDNNNNVKFI